MSTNVSAEPVSMGDSPLPFPPSWIDRWIEWVRRQPQPNWLFYFGMWLLLTIVFIAPVLGLKQAENTIWIGYILTSWSLLVPFYLGYIHYLDGLAGLALTEFRPALDLSDEDYHLLQYELTTMPARNVLLAGAVGLVVPLFTLAPIPEEYQAIFISPFTVVASTFLVFATYFMVAIFIYHTIRQLRLVSHIHAQAVNVNLNRRGPLYAFSVLTARTGIGYLLALMLGVAPRSNYFLGGQLLDISLAFYPLAIAAFFLPLISVHRVIVREKKRRQAENGERLDQIFDELHRRVDTRQISNIGELKIALDALLVERDALNKTPTWPWQAGTLTGFLSAVSLPVIIFLLQQWMARWMQMGR